MRCTARGRVIACGAAPGGAGCAGALCGAGVVTTPALAPCVPANGALAAGPRSLVAPLALETRELPDSATAEWADRRSAAPLPSSTSDAGTMRTATTTAIAGSGPRRSPRAGRRGGFGPPACERPPRSCSAVRGLPGRLPVQPLAELGSRARAILAQQHRKIAKVAVSGRDRLSAERRIERVELLDRAISLSA